MRRSLICAGLVAALLLGDSGGVVPRAEAQVVAPPANPNGLTPQQMRRMRMMMRMRRHHRRHRHKVPVTPVTPVTPTTSMLPAPMMPPVNANRNLTAQRQRRIAAQLRRASF
jgi:hypothetical protein